MKVIKTFNPNHFVIGDGDFLTFQSYNSVIAIHNKKSKALVLGKDWNYSRTTLKYLYMFLNNYNVLELPENANKKETIKKLIKDGKIQFSNELK